MDLFVYFKYYLADQEYEEFISRVQSILLNLKQSITTNAFDNVRGQMGIKDLDDLEVLKNITKEKIAYNKFDTY